MLFIVSTDFAAVHKVESSAYNSRWAFSTSRTKSFMERMKNKGLNIEH